jgi:hypothetical protein
MKIYLSKSKQGDMDTLMKVRSILLQYQDVKILEFEGGEYNTNKLLESDFVLIIPPALPSPDKMDYNDWDFFIGKGQYDEWHTCFTLSHSFYFLVGIHQIGEKDYKLQVINFPNVTVMNFDWKLRYANVFYKISSIFNLALGLKKEEKKEKQIVYQNFKSKLLLAVCRR